MGGSGPPWFLGPTRALNQMASQSVEPVFAGLTIMTDRLSDHATQSVTTGRIYVRSTAMWPNNVHW